ncbi:MAG: T9SS type A sorting domain-containing protein [Bacteroidaceae bacterium]|nr:T9SS type A sorting domain-containing protein [Bacteroidaceae bacterium]
MVKSVLKISKVLLLMVCLSSIPAMLFAETEEIQNSQIEMEQNPISITVSGSTIRVKNAEGQVLEVYSITGDKVYTQNIDSASKTFEFGQLQRGVYIVKIGKFTRKVYLH